MSSIEKLKSIVEAEKKQEPRANNRKLENEEEMSAMRRILEAEAEAERIEMETAAWLDGLEDRVRTKSAILREQFEESIQIAIAEVNKIEAVRAEIKIAKLNDEAESKRRLLENRFEASHNRYVEKIFKMVINCGAE